MVSGKAILGELLGRFIFRHAQVAGLAEPTPCFRRLTLRGSDLRDVVWTPGDKVQVFLGEHGSRS